MGYLIDQIRQPGKTRRKDREKPPVDQSLFQQAVNGLTAAHEPRLRDFTRRMISWAPRDASLEKSVFLT